MAQVRYAA